jgi:hypothetical protein
MGDGKAIKAYSGAGRKYMNLVRLAYFVLPATGRRQYRLAIAQRIVDLSLPPRAWNDRRIRDTAYAPIRIRVLRRAMDPPRRLRVGLGRRLRNLPPAVPGTPEALAALDPAVRAAYVLRRVESLPRHAVRDQLVDMGVVDAMAVVDVADAVPELPLPRVVPGPPLRRRSLLPVVAAGVVTVAAVATAETGTFAGQDAQRGRHAPAVSSTRPAPAVAKSARPKRPAVRVTTVEFWSGRLPGRGPRGRWTCTRYRLADGRVRAVGTLIAGRRRLPTGDCGHVRGGTVSGTWWRAPTGKWFFLAAAGPRIRVGVKAPFPHRRTRDGLLVVPGPRGPERPHAPVTVTARRGAALMQTKDRT